VRFVYLLLLSISYVSCLTAVLTQTFLAETTDKTLKIMNEIKYQIIKPDDNEIIELIASWYLSEWNIPVLTTIEKTKKLSSDNYEFQVLMTLNNKPIATGGLYNHVGILDKEPKLKIYKNWLALVYTRPENRGKGLGALICNHIQDHSKDVGLKDIYLFTHTAENLYKRLGWQQLERLALGGKDIVVMKKEL
jgi:GNAT superfamily N-acetyltransferase